MGEDAELEEDRESGLLPLTAGKMFRRGGLLNVRVAESIKKELEQLEGVGRVSASGQRPVHAGFGFSEMKRDEEEAPPPQRSQAVHVDLDNALERLKSATRAE